MPNSRFDLIQEQVNTDSFLSEWKEKAQQKIEAGEYPPHELTEDKLIEITAKTMLERCQDEIPTEDDMDFFVKILWVILNDNHSGYEYLPNVEAELKKKLRAKQASLIIQTDK